MEVRAETVTQQTTNCLLWLSKCDDAVYFLNLVVVLYNLDFNEHHIAWFSSAS